jgi:UDP-N-acetylglucosamine 2-epimerase
MVVVGTRPEAIKLAPVVQALRGTGLAVRICLSGQHPDLAGAALADFGLVADRLLSACRPGQSLAELGTRALSQLAAAMTRDRPRVVVVQGDTTTALASALRRLVSSHEIGVRFVVHPGVEPELLQQIAAIARVELLAPMSHAAFIAELAGARLAVTDSGGIQEEASVLGVPTLVVRAATERPEVLADGAVQLVGEDALRIERAAAAILADPAPHAKRYAAASAIGDGKASVRIARRVARALMCCRDQSSLAGADCSCT